jgi:hypothetical protein
LPLHARPRYGNAPLKPALPLLAQARLLRLLNGPAHLSQQALLVCAPLLTISQASVACTRIIEKSLKQ